MAGGSYTEPQAGPELPADTAMKMPAARTFSTASSSAAGSPHPSDAVQLYELLITWGARAGSGSCPAPSVGATNHCRHSM